MIVPTRFGNVKSKLKGRQLISPLNEQVKKKNARKVFELTEFIFGHNHVTILQNMVSTSGRGNKKKLRAGIWVNLLPQIYNDLGDNLFLAMS